MHVMLDLETLGVRSNPALLQIGAVPFEPRSGGKILTDMAFRTYVDPGSCVALGATVDAGTFGWWLEQDSGTRDRKSAKDGMTHAMKTGDGVLSVVDAIHSLGMWFQSLTAGKGPVTGVWGHGSCFDVSVVQWYFDLLNLPRPWDHRAPRDTRTLFDLVGGVPQVDITGLVGHDALDDCIWQAQAVQKAMGALRAR